MAEENGTIRTLKNLGIPVTRQTYLDMAFMGNPPEEIGPEIEAMLPEELRVDQEKEITSPRPSKPSTA